MRRQGVHVCQVSRPQQRLLTTFRLKSPDWQASRVYGPFDTELVSRPTAAKGRPLRETAGISMADHRNPGTSCHLITEARSARVRVVLVGSGSYEGTLRLPDPPRP